MKRSLEGWKTQGCPVCRACWESGSMMDLRQICVDLEHHARLYRCANCGAYWEELERFAREISSSAAKALERRCGHPLDR